MSNIWLFQFNGSLGWHMKSNLGYKSYFVQQNKQAHHHSKFFNETCDFFGKKIKIIYWINLGILSNGGVFLIHWQRTLKTKWSTVLERRTLDIAAKQIKYLPEELFKGTRWYQENPSTSMSDCLCSSKNWIASKLALNWLKVTLEITSKGNVGSRWKEKPTYDKSLLKICLLQQEIKIIHWTVLVMTTIILR